MKNAVSRIVVIVAALLLTSIPSFADDAGYPISISTVLGIYIPAAKSNVIKTGLMGGLKVDTLYTDFFGIEGDIGFLSTSTDNGTANALLVSLQTVYPFLVRRNLTPFATLGVGGIIFTDMEKHESSPTLNVGVGVKYFLTDNLALRGDLRDVMTVSNANNNLEITVGVSYLIGAGKRRAVSP